MTTENDFAGIHIVLEAFGSFNKSIRDAIQKQRSGSVRINVQIGSKRVIAAQVQETLDFRPDVNISKDSFDDLEQIECVKVHGALWMKKFETAVQGFESGWMRFSAIFKDGRIQNFSHNPSFDYRP